MGTPPGLYSTYATADGRVTTHARFAVFDESTDPIRAYVFNSKYYTVENERVTPLRERRGADEKHNHVAEYISPTTTRAVRETDVIFYHLDEFDGLCQQNRIVGNEYDTARDNDEIPPLTEFAQYFALTELHELCHWATPADEQPTDHSHWPVWNAILCDAISHANPGVEWAPDFDFDLDDSSSTVTVPDIEQNDSFLPQQQSSEQQQHLSPPD